MTDTAYLYQYFLQNSPAKKGKVPKDEKKSGKKSNAEEVKRHGKPSG